MVSAKSIEEWFEKNKTFYCPHLRLRARIEFCHQLRSRKEFVDNIMDWCFRPRVCATCMDWKRLTEMLADGT